MSGMRLRPEAKRTHGRAPARSVEREERIQQKWNVVPPEIEVAFINFRNPGQLIEILDKSAFGIMNVTAILSETDAGQLLKRRSLGVSGNLVIELAANHKID